MLIDLSLQEKYQCKNLDILFFIFNVHLSIQAKHDLHFLLGIEGI